MNRLKKGDKVVITTGKSKGQTGNIKGFIKNGEYVILDGVHMGKKHVKGNEQQAGSIDDIELPIHCSNLKLVDSTTDKPTRIGYKVFQDTKQRVSKQSGEVIK